MSYSFSVVNLDNGQFGVYEDTTQIALDTQEISGGENVENVQKILEDAVKILNSIKDVIPDLSTIEIIPEGVRVDNRVYSLSEIGEVVQVAATDLVGRNSIDSVRDAEATSEDLSSRNISSGKRGMLSKIKKTFNGLRKSFWRVILYEIAAIFFKYFPESKFVQRNYVEPQNELAEKYLSPTFEKICLFREFSINSEGHSVPELTETLLTPREIRRQGKLNKKIGGPKAYQMGLHKDVKPFEHGKFTTTGYNLDNEITENVVVPTSANYSDNPLDADHLINGYVTTYGGSQSDPEVALIRSGVIDTSRRADELKKLVMHAHGQSADRGKQIRAVSHQLNSPEVPKEKAMIQKQHAFVATTLGKEENISVAHLNSPCNRFYDWTRKGVPFKGEKQSHELNVEGMMQYCLWMLEDKASRHFRMDVNFKKGFNRSLALINKELSKKVAMYQEVEEFESKKREFEDSINEFKEGKTELKEEIQSLADKIASLEKQKSEMEEEDAINALEGQIQLKNVDLGSKNKELEDTKNQISNFNRQISGIKSEIKSKLTQIEEVENEIQDLRRKIMDKQSTFGLFGFYKQLKYKISCLEEKEDQKELVEPLKILYSLLESQLEVNDKKLDRNHELLLFFALDRKLGVIPLINCKSGLDRTGFIHALFTAAIDLPEDKFYHIIEHWSELSTRLNRMYHKQEYDQEKVLDAINDDEDLRIVSELKNKALKHFLAVSLPITGISTGIIGGKYGSGLSANLLPLNCFPPVVNVKKEDGSFEAVQIIRYNRNGKVDGLTSAGQNLITQLSPNRGT